jgi:hypothetical protein
MTPTLLGSIPYEGIKFGMYDVFKRFFHEENDSKEKKVLKSVLSGALAGAFSPNSVAFSFAHSANFPSLSYGGRNRHLSKRHCSPNDASSSTIIRPFDQLMLFST